jgi:hypothetical protein
MKGAVWFTAVVAGLCLVAAVPAAAEDALAVAPGVYRKLMENNRVRVLEANFKPRDKIGLHEQGDHMFYVLTDGTLVLKPPGRTPYEMTFKAGESFWLPAQTRAIENDSGASIKALIVEVKGASSGGVMKAGRSAASRRPSKGRRARRR